jgi:hypothetical protein
LTNSKEAKLKEPKKNLLLPYQEILNHTLVKRTKGWCPHCGLAIYIKKVSLRQKKNYGNSNISP